MSESGTTTGTTQSPGSGNEAREPGTSSIYVPGQANRGYLTWFTLTSIAIAAVWGVAGILLPIQVQSLELPNWFKGADAGTDIQALTLLQQHIDAGTATATGEQTRLLGLLKSFNEAKATSLAIVSTIGVAATMIAQPIVGVLSDRSRTRFGRRAPWILFGGLVGSIALAVLPYAPSVALVAVLFTLAQVLLNAAVSPLNATVADRIAPERRGGASALGGFGMFVGGIGGAVLAGTAFAVLGFNSYLVMAIVTAFVCVMFVLIARDQSSKSLEVPHHSWKEFLLGFTVAMRSANFRWVWVARVLLTFGNTVSTALSLYMMQSYIQPALSVTEATALAPMLSLAAAPFTILAVLLGGRLSDKLSRRKPFVFVSSVIMAGSMIIPIAWPALPALFIQAAVAGLAYGIFLPVDQALFIDVLPDARSAGRDLGVAALGNNLGQALGPSIAGVVLALTGGYLGVWAAALVLVALAAVAILPVRGVR